MKALRRFVDTLSRTLGACLGRSQMERAKTFGLSAFAVCRFVLVLTLVRSRDSSLSIYQRLAVSRVLVLALSFNTDVVWCAWHTVRVAASARPAK